MLLFRRLTLTRLALGLATLLALAPFAHAATPLLAKHVPQIVANGHAPTLGQLPASQHLKLALSLPLRNEAALDALLADIYNPESPNFHHYLSVAEFTERFGPSQAEYDAVVKWAQSEGLAVTGTTINRHLVDVEGSVGTINHAFHVSLNSYQDTTRNRTFFAPDREPTVDSPVTLFAVSGLDNATPKINHYRKDPDANTSGDLGMLSANPRPMISGSGPGNTYLPSDMRAAYYGSGSLTGTGQTVGIFSYDGYLTNDLSVYDSNTGMSSTVPVNNKLVNGYNGACFGFTNTGAEDPNTCDDGEQILDIVQVQGMAPGLTQILFYEGDSSTDVLNQMVTDNVAKTITSSWGGGDFGTASDTPFKEMATQGQTYLNATGDSGAFNADTYDPPSVDPNIVQVGGTDLTTVSAGGAWSSETGWVDSGGGYYTGTAIPTWQQTSGVITSTNKGSTTLRNAPDLAAEANFDNTTVIDGTFESGYGGTSYATPRWAGFIALANQQSVANGKSTLGFINPTLYTIGLSSTASSNYHDITSGTNKASSGSGSFTAVAGYDLVTGWGSPNGPTLINTLAGSTTASYALSASPATLSVATGATGTSTITVTPSGGFTAAVALTAGGLPTGVTAAFSPASATTTSTLTFTVASTATAATTTITITGTSGSLSKTTTVALTVTKAATPTFTLSASPSSLSVATSATGTSTITVTPAGGFNAAVALTASGLPTGVTAAFSPASATTTSTLTFTVGSTATAGTSTITVTGTSGSLTQTTSVALTVTKAATPSFTLSASPSSLSVATSATGTSTITVTPAGGFTAAVALTASGLPTGVTAAFSPASATTTSTLTFTVGSTATAGTSTITVTGTSGSLTQTTTVALTVTAASSPTQVLVNTGFENGTTTTPWTLSSGVICSNSTCSGEVAHAGSWFAWLDGYGSTHTDTATQSVAIPSGKTTATFSFYLHIDTAETTKTAAYDTLSVQVLNSSGTVLGTLATFSNLNAATGYTVHTYSLASYIGQTVTLKFTGKEDSSLQTSFVLDDITLTVQ